VLLAGLAAEGETTVEEPAATRDHTERALDALGVEVTREGFSVTVRRSSYEGFEATVPGDPSSAAFLVAAAALTGSELTITGACLNATRLRFLDVMARMGIDAKADPQTERMGEPVGSIHVVRTGALKPIRVEPDELPLVIDEIPILAALAAHAPGDSRFLGAGELRVKESDRLAAVAASLRALGGDAAEEGDDLVVSGGGLTGGGAATSAGDHRMAMALTVAALAASAPCHIEGVEAADVSFPGFVGLMQSLGAPIEVLT
jgi:3-phosphoshikimate 1-carboxyvinyltransferase